MLTLLICGAVLFAVGAVVVAAGSARALRRLGIDPMRAALWLGLAETGSPPPCAPTSASTTATRTPAAS